MSTQYMLPWPVLKPCLLINGIGAAYDNWPCVGNARLERVTSGILWRLYPTALPGLEVECSRSVDNRISHS